MTIIKQYICNKCGKDSKDSSDLFVMNRYHDIEITFLFGSDLDGTRYNFDLCDDCAKELINSLKNMADSKEIDAWE